MPKNILIVGHSNIGDVCYDLAVVNPLLSTFPHAKIAFLTSRRCENILQGYPGLDKIFLYDAFLQDKNFLGRLRLIRLLRRRKFDAAIVLKSSLLHVFLGVPEVWSVKGNLAAKSGGRRRHRVDAYLELLRSHGIDAPAVFNFKFDAQNKDFCDAFLKNESIAPENKIVGILPIAAWSLKSWPIEKWNSLAEALKKRYGIKVIAFGKSENDSFSRTVLRDISSDITLAVDKTTLGQAMALIARCSLFIAPDSSLLHLASCMGVEVIGLYGPTSAEYFYPYFHPRNTIISKNRLACMPCCPGHTFAPCKKELQPGECMDGISVEEVLRMAADRLC